MNGTVLFNALFVSFLVRHLPQYSQISISDSIVSGYIFITINSIENRPAWPMMIMVTDFDNIFLFLASISISSRCLFFLPITDWLTQTFWENYEPLLNMFKYFYQVNYQFHFFLYSFFLKHCQFHFFLYSFFLKHSVLTFQFKCTLF